MKQTIEKHPVIFIMIGFLIIILIGLLFSSLFRKKDENRKETVTTTEVITTELSETSENQAEVETTTEQMSVNADNYIQTLSEIIVEHFDGLPVTEDLKDNTVTSILMLQMLLKSVLFRICVILMSIQHVLILQQQMEWWIAMGYHLRL